MYEDIDLRKALDTGSSSTGNRLIPEVVSEGLRRFVNGRSVLYNIIPKRDWPTNSYIYREINALPTASFEADGATLPSATRGTYEKRSVAMKYVYTRGEVTGPMIEASRSLLDAMQLEMEVHADGLVRAIEQKIVSGDDSSDADEFDGLLVQIATNVTAAGSVPLTLSILDTALDVPLEYPTHIILNRAMGRRIWALLQAHQRFVDTTVVGAGFTVPSYNQLPIIRMDNGITGLTTTIVMPDMRWITYLINKNITFEMLAKTKDSEDFMLKQYCTLAVEGDAMYHAKITGVLSS